MSCMAEFSLKGHLIPTMEKKIFRQSVREPIMIFVNNQPFSPSAKQKANCSFRHFEGTVARVLPLHKDLPTVFKDFPGDWSLDLGKIVSESYTIGGSFQALKKDISTKKQSNIKKVKKVKNKNNLLTILGHTHLKFSLKSTAFSPICTTYFGP